MMDIEKKIKMALVYTGMTQAELASKIGQTPQNFNKKLKRGSLSFEEMESIAKALGCSWRAEFVFNDGTII